MEFTLWRLKFSISRDQNPQIPPDKVLFDRLHLNGLLRPYFDNKASNIGILLSQISILVTIGYTMLVSDIGTKWGIDKGIWVFVSLGVFGALVLWLVYIAIKVLRAPSFERFLQDFIAQSQTKEERRFAFLFLAVDATDSKRILVEFSDVWQCWLLPNFGKNKSADLNSTEKLCNALASKLAASSADIELLSVNDDLISTKTSIKNNKLTTYYFDIFFAKISENLAGKMNFKTFVLPGGRYAWMTVHELRSHRLTLERNGDVIEHLEQRIIANGVPGLSMAQHVRLL